MNTMLDVTKQELEKHEALTPGVNDYTQNIINAIPFPTVPYSMKAVIAVAQLTNFAAQFRRNIVLWDGDTEVPINAISFVITGSGGGKDSSVNAARKCFKTGFKMIEEHRYNQVVREAIQAATYADEETPNEFAIYKAYMKPIPPIDITPSTGPGLIKHVNDIAELPTSSGFIYTGEFSDELATNSDMVENIKILSELYDLGIKNATYNKGVESRSQAIVGQPISALFVGSPGHILYDEAVKKKFQVAFMSKLARRSFFCYTPDKIADPDFMSYDDPLEAADEYDLKIEAESKEAISSYNDLSKEITKHQLTRSGRPITVSEDVARMFRTYKRYNNGLADTYPNQESTYTLIRRHLQWKALKLAGAFAIMDNSDEIQLHNYVHALQFCELLDGDMNRFERDLNKSHHEKFSDWIHTQLNDDSKAVANAHDLKKQGFITTANKTRLQELCTLSAAYDTDGIYTVVNEGSAIQYEPIIKTDVINVSFKDIDTTRLTRATEEGDKSAISKAKHQISATTAYGFDMVDTTFAELAELLQYDYAYSPFKFRNGERGKDNVIGGTKWLVFDVDDSALTASETHLMLGNINHHIALSSDPDNEYKFRLLVELDSVVDISSIAWKYFCAEVAHELAIRIDPLPQSQIFFSYAGRPVYSQLDAEPLEVRDFVMAALDRESTKAVEQKPTTAQAKTLLNDVVNTFNYAFEARPGEGSRSLIRAAYHAQHLGATVDQTKQLIIDINDYWYSPLEEERLEKILGQITRMF